MRKSKNNRFYLTLSFFQLGIMHSVAATPDVLSPLGSCLVYDMFRLHVLVHDLIICILGLILSDIKLDYAVPLVLDFQHGVHLPHMLSVPK